jgi:hypothetical protein
MDRIETPSTDLGRPHPAEVATGLPPPPRIAPVPRLALTAQLRGPDTHLPVADEA